MSKKKPIIRKQAFISKVKSYPFDFFLWLNELRHSIEWDDYCDSIATPLGCILTLYFCVLNKISVTHSRSPKENSNSLFQADYYNYEKIRRRAITGDDIELRSVKDDSIWLTLVDTTLIILFISSLWNFICVFRSSRDYALLYSSMDKRPHTKSARRLSLKTNTEESVIDKIILFFYNLTADIRDSSMENESFYDNDSTNEANSVEKEVWELCVWDPPKFSLYLFTTFCPATLIIDRLTSNSIAFWKSLLLITLFNAILYYVIANKFLTLLQDKQILYQEMFQEYNNKFVKPKTSVLKKDVLVDATYGPRLKSSLAAKSDKNGYFQNTKLKVFITHDINGNSFNNLNVENEDVLSPAPTPLLGSRVQSRGLNELESPFRTPYRNDVLNTSLSQRQYPPSAGDRRPVYSSMANNASFGTLRNTPQHNIDSYRTMEDQDNKLWYASSTPFKRNSVTSDTMLHRSSPLVENNYRNFQSPNGKITNGSLKRADLSPSRTQTFRRSPSPMHKSPMYNENDMNFRRSPSPGKPKPRWH